MKKLLMILLLAFSVSIYAQNERKYKSLAKDFTPEQQAILKTKKMALELDLNDTQQSQMLSLNKKWAIERDKNRKAFKGQDPEEITATDRFNMMDKMLDTHLANQKQVKKILNADQYETWKRSGKNKGYRSAERQGRQQGRGHNNKK
jgi:protein CpxP